MARDAVQKLTVYSADLFAVVAGANLGDPLSFAADLLLNDIYELRAGAKLSEVWLAPSGDRAPFAVADASPTGAAGRDIYLDCVLTLMSPDGSTSEALVAVEVEDGAAEAVYVAPFADLVPEREYTLVGVDIAAARRRLAEVSCLSFTRGTHITLATGEQRKIEDLVPGDRILTRDDGSQELRWVGQNTVRAAGDAAPIRIEKGALNNENDLIVSPEHRLFIYQRVDELGVGRAEVLIRARQLLNGTTVQQIPGGFVDYFQLVFDSHQIIYAEGIAAETMVVDTRTGPALPEELAERLGQLAPAARVRDRLTYEVPDSATEGPDTVARLRRASTRGAKTR